MLTVVTWIWLGERTYLPLYVNVLRSMLSRHLKAPHRLVCVTDETEGFDPRIELMPTPAAALGLASIKSPEGGVMPSCYRRLWLFSDEAKCLGDRILLTDIDAVIVGDITHLVERTEPFVGWRPVVPWGNRERVAGGLYLLTPGSHTEVWADFGTDGIAEARKAGYRGSDQAWISFKFGKTAALWKDSDGIYALSDMNRGAKPLPKDARMVQFSGLPKPWEPTAPDWVRTHYV